jgi:hypothetical protein
MDGRLAGAADGPGSDEVARPGRRGLQHHSVVGPVRVPPEASLSPTAAEIGGAIRLGLFLLLMGAVLVLFGIGDVTSDAGARTNCGGVDTIGDDGAGPSRVPVGQEGLMTETREIDVIAEALSVIDRALAEMVNRELVSTGEVADVLLDVRSLLTTQAPSES